MKYRDFVQHLVSHGCIFARHGSRHDIYENPANGRRAPVPRHREVPEVYVRGICKQLGIPRP